jgi:hypothetical protein
VKTLIKVIAAVGIIGAGLAAVSKLFEPKPSWTQPLKED